MTVTNADSPRVTLKDVETAFFRQKRGKAPGYHGVRAVIVKRAFSWILLNIVNEVVVRKNFPKIWKKGILETFLKDPETRSSLIDQ